MTLCVLLSIHIAPTPPHNQYIRAHYRYIDVCPSVVSRIYVYRLIHTSGVGLRNGDRVSELGIHNSLTVPITNRVRYSWLELFQVLLFLWVRRSLSTASRLLVTITSAPLALDVSLPVTAGRERTTWTRLCIAGFESRSLSLRRLGLAPVIGPSSVAQARQQILSHSPLSYLHYIPYIYTYTYIYVHMYELYTFIHIYNYNRQLHVFVNHVPTYM